jgi:endonuclease/exonuclease/phosphatase family metal-dependent hydrolase
MRLLSWNIHKGIGGLDRRYDLTRILEVIHHYDPDVCVLQEVDRGVPRSREHDQANLLAEVLGYPHRAFQPNVVLRKGCYGNATLSRYPFAEERNINLSISLKKPRGALYTEIHARIKEHTRTIHLYNCHLGLSGTERRLQVRRLLDSVPLNRLGNASRVIIAGDTNDWNGALARGRLRVAGFTCATGRGARASLTFPAWRPVSALDRVYLRGPVVGNRHFRGRLRQCLHASDHLPIVIELELLGH